jgi:hypothetical protein
MKRTIVIAMLIIALAATGFAQELKFDGYVNSGLGLLSSNKKDQDSVLRAFGVDGESPGYRFRLNGSYTSESKNIGAKIRLQAQRTAANPVSLPYFYGWVKFFNIFTLNGGLVDDSTWQTADWWIADDSGEGLGLLLKATPIEGLDLGVGAYTVNVSSGGSNQILSNGTNYRFADKWYDAKYVIAAAYTMKDLFRVGATFRNANKADASASGDRNLEPYNHNGQYESKQLLAEVRFLGIKDLTAVAAVNVNHLERYAGSDDPVSTTTSNSNSTDAAAKGSLTFSESFAYKLSDLSVGLNMVEFFYNEKSGKRDANGNLTDEKRAPAFLFNLWGQYAIGKIVPRLDLVYFINGRSNMIEIDDGSYHRKGYTQRKAVYNAAANEFTHYSVFTIRPSVKFNLDSKTFIEVGDAINFDSADKKGSAYSTTDNLDKKNRTTNVFYADVKFSF